MKKNNCALFWLLLFLASCAGGGAYRKITVELPAYSPLNLEQFKEVAITNFLVAKEPAGIDLNKEIADYFKQEFEKKFRGKVSSRHIPLESEDLFKKPDFWKSLSADSASLLYVTGKAQMSQETRKAILNSQKSPEDETLSPQKNISERNVFTLDISLYLIKGETGEILFGRDFKEIKTYTNPKQRADFAFNDLVQRVKTKLFRPILSEERIQHRYLLLK